MTPERYARICELFDEAEKVAPERRDSFLSQACAGDPHLRSEVEDMLSNARRDRDTAPFIHRDSPVNLRGLLAEEPRSPALLGRRIGPYEISREIGSGGMGTVYLAARVDDYHQQVALKVLRSGLATDELLQRFRTERQVLAGLTHPNVARLLDGGTTADGLLYFVMEHIEGQPLDRYCTARQLPVRARARLLLAVCSGVEHAHQHGIIHRDLKPGNVLVTGEGILKVLDFGLAKQLGPRPAGPGADSGRTQTGVILGTPSYMAPEQAGGRAGEAGPAADVWALGAILYELLTGRPPFRADSQLETLMQVLSEEPVPPARLHPNLPRDLETICLKCLQKEQHKRYPSAQALADDLQRFLDGVPIQARPVGRVERVYRWGRRNPKEAGLLALLVLALGVGFSAVTALWLLAERRGEDARTQADEARRERDRAEKNSRLAEQRGADARQKAAEARRQRDRAEKNFERVFSAVQESFVQVSKSKELEGEDMLPFREKLLEGALKQFREFVKELGDNPRAREQLAKAHLRVGEILRARGRSPAAAAETRKAVDLIRGLVAEKPEDRSYRSLLALAYEYQGRTELAPAESVRALRRALELREALVRDCPEHAAAYRSQLAYSYHNAGAGLDASRSEEALRWLGKARAIREEQARAQTDRDQLEHLALACLVMGAIQKRAGRDSEAPASVGRAIEVYRRLTEAFPNEPGWHISLANAHIELDLVQGRTGRAKGVAAPLEQARAILEKLLAREPAPGADLLAPQVALAKVYFNLAMQDSRDFSRWAKAAARFRKVRELCDRVLTVRPAHGELLYLRGVSCYNSGAFLTTPGEEARKLHEEARATFERLVRLQPSNAESRSYLAQTLQSLGLRAARARPTEAVALLRQAIEHQTRVHAAHQSREHAAQLAAHYRVLAGVLRAQKRPGEAAAAVVACAKLSRGQPTQLYGCALDLARCLPLVGAESGTPTPAQQAERCRYADLALAELRAAVAAGYANAGRLRTDSEWEPLRERAEFRELLRKVETGAKRGK